MSELQLFRNVRGNNPYGNRFDLDFTVNTSCNIGEVVPVLFEECIPGDYWRLGAELGVRLQPMNAPINDDLYANIDYFFVPYRLLDENWVKFITGGTNGNYVGKLPVMPWQTKLADNDSSLELTYSASAKDAVAAPHTLWDYLGHPLPTDLDWFAGKTVGVDSIPDIRAKPMAYPWLAYNMIRWYYYTDQNLNPDYMDNVEWKDLPQSYIYSNSIFTRPYRKDYFTSALPFQQRGSPPSLPLSGHLPVSSYLNTEGELSKFGYRSAVADNPRTFAVDGTASDILPPWNSALVYDIPRDGYLYAAAAGATTFTVSEMRQVFAIQKWMELNARGGARYNEFLQSHFGISPDDSTLQRPEFLGRHSQPILISEVLQQSSTVSGGALGDFAGHGISYSQNYTDGYKVEEFGVIIGLLSVMPSQSYFQGINRQWLRRSRFDFYFPEFANLSEQGIYNAEIYVQNDSADLDTDFLSTVNGQVFGFQGIYDEMRIKSNRITGMMRDKLDYWHLARKFANAPALNEDFIMTKDTDFDRIFAVQDEDQLIVVCKNYLAGSIRPMPEVPDPGLVDHVY